MINPDMNLEQAQYAYGRNLVPWILDEDDLKIINRTRRTALEQTGSCMKIDDGHGGVFCKLKDIDEVIRKRLWYAAQKG